MSPARKTYRELDSLIAEITVDCYDEDEQLTAFENAFDEDANFPCPGIVIGEEIEVLSVTTRNGRRELMSTCQRGGRRHELALLDIDLHGDPARHAFSPHTAAGSATESTPPEQLRCATARGKGPGR